MRPKNQKKGKKKRGKNGAPLRRGAQRAVAPKPTGQPSQADISSMFGTPGSGQGADNFELPPEMRKLFDK